MSGAVKKKINPGAIELHPDELAIVVNYEVQEVHVDSGDVLRREQATKKLSFKTLTDKTDVPLLAGEVVETCKLIHPSKVSQVEQLLCELQQRLVVSKSPTPSKSEKADAPPPPPPPPANGNGMTAPAAAVPPPRQGEDGAKEGVPGATSAHHTLATDAEAPQEACERQQQQQASQIFKVQHGQLQPACMDKLEDDVEDLYEEDMAKKALDEDPAGASRGQQDPAGPSTSIASLDCPLLGLITSHMDAETRGRWRLVDKAARRAVYAATQKLSCCKPHANPITSLPLTLLERCRGLTELSCLGLLQLHSLDGLPLGLQVLDISHTDVSDLSPLCRCTALRTLVFDRSLGHGEFNTRFKPVLPPASYQQLPSTFQHLPGLRVLCLSNHRMGEAAAPHLALALRHASTLQSLNLYTNYLGAKGLQALAPTLEDLHELRSLSLGYNEIDEAGAQSLAPAFQGMTPLTCLDMCFNFMGEEGITALAPALRKLAGLEVLWLNYTMYTREQRQENVAGAGGPAASALAPALQQLTRLRELNLTCNELGVQGVRALMPALQRLTGLQALHLQRNGPHEPCIGYEDLKQELDCIMQLTAPGCQVGI